MKLCNDLNLKSFFCILFAIISILQISIGQNIILETQDDIDNYYDDYGHLEMIKGNLCIGNAFGTSDINSLEALINLRQISGNLIIEGTLFLHSLRGLENLQFIKGSLHVEFNTGLEEIESLANLEDVGHSIEIKDNFNLQSLLGLNGIRIIPGNLKIIGNGIRNGMGTWPLESVGDRLEIFHNSQIESLKIFGWRILEEVFSLTIFNNGQLSDLAGLGSITRIGHKLAVSQNQNLRSLKGLKRLENIGTVLDITSCQNLTSLEGLERIQNIGENSILLGFQGAGILCASNPNLQSLKGIENIQNLFGTFNINNCESLLKIDYVDDIDHSNLTSILLQDNDMLEICNSDLICRFGLAKKPLNILNNAPGCNSIDEIVDSCN